MNNPINRDVLMNRTAARGNFNRPEFIQQQRILVEINQPEHGGEDQNRDQSQESGGQEFALRDRGHLEAMVFRAWKNVYL